MVNPESTFKFLKSGMVVCSYNLSILGLRLKDSEFEATLSYTVRHYLLKSYSSIPMCQHIRLSPSFVNVSFQNQRELPIHLYITKTILIKWVPVMLQCVYIYIIQHLNKSGCIYLCNHLVFLYEKPFFQLFEMYSTLFLTVVTVLGGNKFLVPVSLYLDIH